MSAKRDMNFENTSSETGQMCSERKRLTVLWSRGCMSQIQRNPTFSHVAWAILWEEQMPWA